MVVLYLIGFKYTLWNIFHPPNQVLVVQTLIQGFLENYFFENTIWPNYFCKKILCCTIHMVWSLGRSFGSMKGSIEGEGMLTFKSTWKHREKTNSKKSNNAKVFVKPHFIMIYHLKYCAMKIRVWETCRPIWKPNIPCWYDWLVYPVP